MTAACIFNNVHTKYSIFFAQIILSSIDSILAHALKAAKKSHKMTQCCCSNSSFISLRLLIVLFKMFGLAPFATKIVIDNENNQEKNTFKIEFSSSVLGSIYNLLIVLIILSEIIYNYILWPMDAYILLQIYNLFKKIGLITIILSFLFRRKSLIKIIETLYAINNAFDQSDILRPLSHREKFYRIVTVIVYLTISLILMTSYIISEIFYLKKNSFIANINIVVEYAIIFTIGWFITQYSLLLIFVYHKLCMFNESFELCFTGENYSIDSQNCFVCENTLLKFISLRKLYQNTYSALSDIARLYSLPILVAFVIIIPKLISVVNNTIDYNESRDESILLKVFNNLMMIFLYFPVINLTVFATKINEEVRILF
ncbi:GSCOCT00014103001.2-RA-CDS, partial [Cotesia congregata]